MPVPSSATWIVAAYRVPATPSTARVAAWRGLRELGAIILGMMALHSWLERRHRAGT